jgi:transcriptional/translational regulatory protein YebC/TACO1
MTRDTLNRAIARGVGGDDDANMETIIYEGYGPGGTAVMVECLSDNRNRTVAEVRHAFTKTGGNLGTDGSVSYLFSKKASSPSRKAMKTLSWKRRWKRAQKTW